MAIGKRVYPADQRKAAQLKAEWGSDWCGLLGSECCRRVECPMHVGRRLVNRYSYNLQPISR